jgi:hypothetical protein
LGCWECWVDMNNVTYTHFRNSNVPIKPNGNWLVSTSPLS